jgi:class 3 adenylate cyclase
VKAVFGRYLPKAVADRALAQQGDLVLGGEERDVAILFADIRGFTILSEHIPPQDLVAMLNGYFTRMVDIILDHDGTVDKYVGDAIMAIFGAPVADERAADKAVAAALEMMRALAPFNADRAEAGRPPIEIGIGVNRGLVIAGNLGSIKQLSYTVIGEEVNLASRLCANAARGQILISEAVNAKLTREFDCHRLDPITVKNVSHPVQVYEVLNERKPVGRTNTGA